jgi:MioC protein
MEIRVLYGTDGGNAELVAEDLGEHLRASTPHVSVANLRNFDPTDFVPGPLYVVICSTHGNGELPASAVPFAEAFDAAPPDLTGVTYAMFGMGDRFYADTYSKGSEHLDRRLSERGATRIGEYGRHDASAWNDPTETAIDWITSVRDAVIV